MKYDFLVKEKFKNTSFENGDNKSIIGSTYEDFNIFLKKTQDKENIAKNEIDDKNDNKNDKNNKVSDLSDTPKIKKENSTLFESEKKTVETIVKYSSNFINLLLQIIFILKNSFLHLISKNNSNTDTIKDKEIIDKFNKNIKKNDDDKHIKKSDKHIKKSDKHIKKSDKHIKKSDNYKHIKKMNSYLLDLDK
jgi:hypothetical protein